MTDLIEITETRIEIVIEEEDSVCVLEITEPARVELIAIAEQGIAGRDGTNGFNGAQGAPGLAGKDGTLADGQIIDGGNF